MQNSMIYMRFIRRISSYGVSERDRRDGFSKSSLDALIKKDM